MFLQSEISDIMIQSHVHVVFVTALGTAVEKDGSVDSSPAGTNVDGNIKS